MLSTRLLLLFVLLWLGSPLQADQELFLEGRPDAYLPVGLPAPQEKYESDTQKVAHQRPAASYIYRWRYLDKKGIPQLLEITFRRYEPNSTAYGYGSYTKSNTMAAYLSTLGTLSTKIHDYAHPAEYRLVETGIPPKHYEKCQCDLAKEVSKEKAPLSSYAVIFGEKASFKQMFLGHYANYAISVTVGGADDTYSAANIGHAVLARMSGKGAMGDAAPPAEPTPQAEAKVTAPGVRFEVFAEPSAAGNEERIAYLPASNKLPARLAARTTPGTPVTFDLQNSKDAILQAGNSTGQRLTVKADTKGLAQVLFYYTGASVSSPLSYEIRVSQPSEKDRLIVNVGLGLAFDRIQAVKGDMRDTYPFTLTLKSRFYPKLRIGDYLTAAADKGIWNGLTIGVALDTQWVNMPPGAPADESFRGTTRIVSGPNGENMLTVANNDGREKTQYYLTKYPYPAVVMKSDGRHAYRITGELVLLDGNGANLGGLEESLQQPQTLAIVARDTPEHWLTSLVCALEVTTTEQYVLLETAKMLPVGGEAVDVLTTVTGMMCKIGQAEYESLFYDIGTVLGGKYLDHLMEPEVFEKLTPKQQTAVQLAKKAYDDLDEYKKDKEREKWLSRASKPPSEPEQTPPSGGTGLPAADELKELGKAIEENADKAFKDVRETLKGLFKKK